MNLMKRIAGLLAMSLLVTQMVGVGTAFASSDNDECDFGNTDLEVTLGDDYVDLYINDTELGCYSPDSATTESISLKALKSLTVEMDDEEDSDGSLFIYLDDDDNDAAAWPKFDTFDIDVTTKVWIDGSDVDDDAGNSIRVTVGPKSVSFMGTTATSNAPAYHIRGGDLKDTIDASTATAKIEVDGGDGNDLIKGGSNRDELYGDADLDTIYGGGGNDTIDCGDSGYLFSSPARLEYGWGGSGDDFIEGCVVTAPGTGDDEIASDSTDLTVTYADVTEGAELSFDSSGVLTTAGGAGDDTFDDGDGDYVYSLSGTQGDDVMVDEYGHTLKGLGGDDVIRTEGTKAYGGDGNDLIAAFLDGNDNKFYGEGGNDILRGKDGDDKLYGGGGQDQGWGGSGSEDLCRTEVTNRCELYGKK